MRVCGRCIAVVAALAWAVPALPAPPCTVASGAADGRVGMAAGCFVKQGARLLVVRHRYSGKLGVPAGFSDAAESAQCTAHRETWEEAGLVVEVGGLLKKFGNGFLLYRCRTLDAPPLREPPARGSMEISAVLWVEPASTDAAEWRFNWQYPELMRLFREEPGS